MSAGERSKKILQMLEEYGSDLSKRMIVDLHFLVPDEHTADCCLDTLTDNQFVARTFKPGSHQRYSADNMQAGSEWLVECSVNMIPTAETILKQQDEIENLLTEYEAISDGWASYGNNFSARPRADLN